MVRSVNREKTYTTFSSAFDHLYHDMSLAGPEKTCEIPIVVSFDYYVISFITMWCY
jgi:hypothetical protein